MHVALSDASRVKMSVDRTDTCKAANIGVGQTFRADGTSALALINALKGRGWSISR